MSESVMLVSGIMPFEIDDICGKLKGAGIDFTTGKVDVHSPRGDVFSKGGVGFYYQVFVLAEDAERARVVLNIPSEEDFKKVSRDVVTGESEEVKGKGVNFLWLRYGLLGAILGAAMTQGIYALFLGWLAIAIMKKKNWARVTFMGYALVCLVQLVILGAMIDDAKVNPGISKYSFLLGGSVIFCTVLLCKKSIAKEFVKVRFGVLWGLLWWGLFSVPLFFVICFYLVHVFR